MSRRRRRHRQTVTVEELLRNAGAQAQRRGTPPVGRNGEPVERRVRQANATALTALLEGARTRQIAVTSLRVGSRAQRIALASAVLVVSMGTLTVALAAGKQSAPPTGAPVFPLEPAPVITGPVGTPLWSPPTVTVTPAAVVKPATSSAPSRPAPVTATVVVTTRDSTTTTAVPQPCAAYDPYGSYSPYGPYYGYPAYPAPCG